MKLWSNWWKLVSTLRFAFSRAQTFNWFVLSLIAFSVRTDLNGVTSFVRALGLKPCGYERLLHFFHSDAVNLDKLSQLWLATVLKFFPVQTQNGKPIAIIDGVKIPKEGKKMPSVKYLHQGSGSNSKPEFVMGHSFQSFGILCCVKGYHFCVPVCAIIHEGLVFSNRDKQTLIDKAGSMLGDIFGKHQEFLLLADAYYANGKMLKALVALGSILISRVRTNAVAYEKASAPTRKQRGRPKLYGTKIKLSDLFFSAIFTECTCNIYGEKVRVEYLCKDLIWKPFGKLTRFVLVKHPRRGRMILMSSDLSISPIEMIELYSLRFKIEVTFKHAIRNVGAFSYHFWMAEMTPLKQKSGNQYLHKKEQRYRDQVRRKIKAYHCFVQTGLIAQGMLQYLSMTQTQLVWNHFGSWIRTIRPGILPSEAIVSNALWNTLPYFLQGSITGGIVEKFISSRIDRKRAESMRFAG